MDLLAFYNSAKCKKFFNAQTKRLCTLPVIQTLMSCGMSTLSQSKSTFLKYPVSLYCSVLA